MTTCLSIPKIWNASEDYNKLFKLWEQISNSPFDEDFELDFRNCKFLGHNGVAFLGGLAHFIQPTFSRLFRAKNNICRRTDQETAKLDSVYRKV